jgi:phosphoribosyl-ATP pyrophosphohydrolase
MNLPTVDWNKAPARAAVVVRNASTRDIVRVVTVSTADLKSWLEKGVMPHGGGSYDIAAAAFDPELASVVLDVSSATPALLEPVYPRASEASVSPAILDEVYSVIMERKRQRPEGSYVGKTLAEGSDRIHKKGGEEAGETIIAFKNNDSDEIGWEIADLLFHVLLGLGCLDLSPQIVYRKLAERRK